MDEGDVTLINAARGVLKASGYFVDNLWHVEDVHFLCEQRGWPKLDGEEAKEVFVIFNQQFDGEQGLTWAKLEQATQIYLAQKHKVHIVC